MYQCIIHKKISFAGIPKFYFILLTYFCLSLRQAYIWSGFEPGLTITVGQAKDLSVPSRIVNVCGVMCYVNCANVCNIT